MLQNVTQKNFDPESLIVGMDEKEIKQLVLKIFEYRCAIGGCGMPAGTVHEIVPRARGKKSLMFRNRMSICNNHHDLEHYFGASPSRIKVLRQHRATYLLMINKPEYV